MEKSKKEQRDALETNAKLELQKTQQLSISGEVKELLLDRQNKKLKNNLILRDKRQKNRQSLSLRLLDRIQDEQNFLDDLRIEIDSTVVETYASYDIARQAIAELKKTDVVAASKLENALNLKIGAKKSRTIVKKRL